MNNVGPPRFVALLALALACASLCLLPQARAQLLNAWQTTDSSTGTGSTLYYTSTLTAGQQIAATNSTGGFHLTVVARMIDRIGNDRATMLMAYGLGNKRFLIWFDLDGSGDLAASFDDVNTITLTTGGIGATLYHTHEIIYNPDTGTASYLYDGQVKTNNWPAVNHNLPAGEVRWGASAQTGTGRMNFHSVNFDITGLGSVASYDAGTSNNPAVAPNPTNSVPAWTRFMGTGTSAIDISPDVVPLPATPSATTLDATDVGHDQATLAGVMNPGSLPTRAWFEWGANTNYGNATSPQAVLSGTNNFNLARTITGLAPGGTYHFRCVATNALGVAYGQDAVFTTSDFGQQAYFKASNTDAGDQFGFSVAMSDTWVVIGAPGEDSSAEGVNGNQADNSANGSGAAYVFNGVYEATWSQWAYLKKRQSTQGENFGASVAVWGDWFLVGAPRASASSIGEAGKLEVFLFEIIGRRWEARQILQSENPQLSARFGHSVAIDQSAALPGPYFMVGSPYRDTAGGGADAGWVETFRYNSGTRNWDFDEVLIASPQSSRALFGWSIAVSGDTAVVGAPGHTSSQGRAFVYKRLGFPCVNCWALQGSALALSTPAPNDKFGNSVAIAGDTIVVGAPGRTISGRVYVFARAGTTWSQQAELTASHPLIGGQFGSSVAVAVEGNTVVVGSPGRAYVFARSGTNWLQQAQLTAIRPDAGDNFGASVAMWDDRVVVGAYGEDSNATGVNGNQADNSAIGSGAAYMFMPGAIVPPGFRITSIVRTNDNDLLITWNTRGTTNIVQVTVGAGASGGFSPNDFADVTNIVVATETTNFWDVGAVTNRPARYYRIRSP